MLIAQTSDSAWAIREPLAIRPVCEEGTLAPILGRKENRPADGVAELAHETQQCVKVDLRSKFTGINVKLDFVIAEEMSIDSDSPDNDLQHRAGNIAQSKDLR
jgi:hypothetical protein